MTEIRLLEGREYGMRYQRYWPYKREILHVRIVSLYADCVEVKILSTIKFDPFAKDDILRGCHTTVRHNQLVCHWESLEQFLQSEREAENKKPPWTWSRGPGKHKRRKWRGLSKPGSPHWEDSVKETRTRANRRDRHQTKQKLHTDNFS